MIEVDSLITEISCQYVNCFESVALLRSELWVYIALYYCTYIDMTVNCIVDVGLRYKEPVSELSSPELSELQQSLFNAFVTIALVCGGVQTLIWSTYTLKGKHLQAIKAARGARGTVPTSKGVDVKVRG